MTPMTQEEFELARIQYGADLAGWPDAERTRADAFLATPGGASFAQAEGALDALFASARIPAMGDRGDRGDRGDQGADAFLDRLLDIPGEVTHPLEVKAPSNGGGLASLWAEMKAFFSPFGGLAGQGVAYAAVLAVGVYVGMQGAGNAPIEPQSVDLSASLFPSSDFVDLEDL